MQNSALPTTRTFITNLVDALPAAPPQSSTDSTNPSNPLASLPETTRKQLLALHVLFPNEFLSALDLLDRRLVTRFRVRQEQDEERVAEAVAPRGRGVRKPGKEGVGTEERVGVENSDGMFLTPGIGTAASIGGNDVGGSAGDVEAERPTSGNNGDRGIEDNAQGCRNRNPIYYVRSAQQRTSRYSTSYDSTTSYEVRLTPWNCSCPAFAFAAFLSIHPEPTITQSEAEWESEGEGNWSFGGVSLGDGMVPVCKHLLACVLAERCNLFQGFVEEKEVSVEEAAGWAAGWGD